MVALGLLVLLAVLMHCQRSVRVRYRLIPVQPTPEAPPSSPDGMLI